MGNGGKIEVYLDCNSPWSCFAYTYLRKNRAALQQHDIDIIMYPIFLGGINVGSGNKPPWNLPAKARLGLVELPRAMNYFGVHGLRQPPFFPIMSLLPMRAMLYAQEHCDYQKYERAFGELWTFLWVKHRDVSQPDVLRDCLGLHFDKEEVDAIMEAAVSPEYKQKLRESTTRLVEKGAFGAPWFLVTNREGKEECFFGSDRWQFMYQFLDIPFQDIQILPPSKNLAKL